MLEVVLVSVELASVDQAMNLHHSHQALVVLLVALMLLVQLSMPLIQTKTVFLARENSTTLFKEVYKQKIRFFAFSPITSLHSS